MKRIQLCWTKLKRLRIDSSGKEIDGIPDVSGFEHPVSAGQHGHRYCPGNATLDASRYRVGFQGKPHTDEFGRDGHALDNAALGGYAWLLEYKRHGFLVLVRKHFAEPANTTRDSKDN